MGSDLLLRQLTASKDGETPTISETCGGEGVSQSVPPPQLTDTLSDRATGRWLLAQRCRMALFRIFAHGNPAYREVSP